MTSTLEEYRQSFAAAAGTKCVATKPRSELLLCIAAGRILWLGDHHRSSRLHALQSELLDELQQRGVAMLFALEAIGQQDEPLVQRYLSEARSMEDLEADMRARWQGSWLDDRELDPWHYRSLLAFARRHRVPVVGLEPTPRLRLDRRDAMLTTSIRTALARHPDRLVVVHVGQAHLLGDGDLIARVAAPGVAIGGELPATLLSVAPASLARGSFWQSDSGLWWFGELSAKRD